MDSSRRNFLKIAGITAVAGIGAPSALNMFMKKLRLLQAVMVSKPTLMALLVNMVLHLPAGEWVW